MKFFVIFCLFVALSVSAVAQENNDSANLEDIEGVEQAALSISSLFVKESFDFIETPYFPLLLGFAPYAPTLVVITPIVITIGLILLADTDGEYLETISSTNQFSATATAITLPIGLIVAYIMNVQYIYPTLFFGVPGFGEPDLGFFGFVGALLGEIINASVFSSAGLIWANLLAASTLDIDDIDNPQDFTATAATVAGGLYLATSIARGIIASSQNEIGANPNTSKITNEIAKHWRVAPTISGIEAVYSY